MWRYIHTDELRHYGVPGMKWGVIRSRSKSGSSKPKISKKLALIKAKLAAKKKAKKVEDDDSQQKKSLKRQIREMSDADLKNRLNRLQNEQQVLKLETERASAGQRFVSTVGKEVIKPALIESGKRLMTDLITKVGKEQLKIDDNKNKDSKLKKEVQDLELKQRKIKAEEWLNNNEILKKKAKEIERSKTLEDDILDIIENNKKFNKK